MPFLAKKRDNVAPDGPAPMMQISIFIVMINVE
jgi:hypothetical protein